MSASEADRRRRSTPPLLPPGHLPVLIGRQPKREVSGRLHPAVLFRPIVRAVQVLIPVALVDAAGNADLLWIFVAYGVAFILQMAAAVIRYATFTFHFDGERLELSWGVLSRHTRTLPVARVINMSSKRALWHRIFGAVEVRVETAGGADEDAVIEALSSEDAARLQAVIRECRPDAGRSAVGAAEDHVVRRFAFKDGVLHGLTSNVLAAVGFILGVILDNLDSLQFLEFDTKTWMRQTTPEMIVLAVLACLALIWLGSIVTSLVRFHGFTLMRSPAGDLTTRFGLITVHEGRIFRGRVQDLVIHESPLRRPFGLASLRVLSAGSTGVEEPKAGSEILLPLARMREVPALAREVFPELDSWPEFRPVHPRSRRRNMVRIGWLPLLLACGAAFEWPTALLALPPILGLTWVLARLRYANTGYQVTDAFVFVRSGILGRTTHVVPKTRLQTMSRHENPIDRRLGLSTLTLDTAARTALHPPRVPDIPPATADHIRSACLQQAFEEVLSSEGG